MNRDIAKMILNTLLMWGFYEVGHIHGTLVPKGTTWVSKNGGQCYYNEDVKTLDCHDKDHETRYELPEQWTALYDKKPRYFMRDKIR